MEETKGIRKRRKFKQALTKQTLASRILHREDNIYKSEVILDIISKYIEEMQLALERGEKVGISGIGSITPRVHTPKSYNIDIMNTEEGSKPYTTLRFTRRNKIKQNMNSIYRKSIKDGIYGLGEDCMCTPLQVTLLKEKGYIDGDIEDLEEEYEDEYFDDTDEDYEE